MQPIAFFDFVRHYGGSFINTVRQIEVLSRQEPVVVVDAFGTCTAYRTALAEAGIPTHVLLPNWQGEITIGGHGVRQRVLRMVSTIPVMSLLTARLRATLRQIQPSVLWTTSEKALFVASLAASPSLPILMAVHTELRSIRPYCALAWRRVDAVVGVSNNAVRYLRSTGYAREKISVVHNGVDANAIRSAALLAPGEVPHGAPPTDLRILLPASFAGPQKGHESAIRALAQFVAEGGRAQLWLCGDVPTGSQPDYYQHVRDLVRETKMEGHVRFLGWRADVPSLMASADVVMLPSHSEGFGLVLLEGMALGRPVIATAVGGIPELVRDDVDGILVAPDDASAIVKALQRLQDPAFRQQMGSCGQQRAVEDFALIDKVDQFRAVIRSVTPAQSRERQP